MTKYRLGFMGRLMNPIILAALLCLILVFVGRGQIWLELDATGTGVASGTDAHFEATGAGDVTVTGFASDPTLEKDLDDAGSALGAPSMVFVGLAILFLLLSLLQLAPWRWLRVTMSVLVFLGAAAMALLTFVIKSVGQAALDEIETSGSTAYASMSGSIGPGVTTVIIGFALLAALALWAIIQNIIAKGSPIGEGEAAPAAPAAPAVPSDGAEEAGE